MKVHLFSLLIFSIFSLIQPGSDKPEALISKNKKHFFSSAETMDIFTVSIVGESILEGKMIFQIQDSKGQEIFKEVYPSTYLIGYGFVGKNPTKEEKEAYIKKRINEFFHDENFFEPAISVDDKFDPDYSDKNIWEEIKTDKTAIGFYYLIGEEQGCRIAYLKQRKKVVKYFYCC